MDNKEKKEVVEQLEREEETSKKEKKRRVLILILLLLFLCTFGITVMYKKGIFQNIENSIIEIFHLSKPTSPVITGGNKEWATERLISVKKDAYSKNGIDYYEYCVREKKETKNCQWEKTTTKNTIVSKSGIYYVTFRAVDKEGKRGNSSNTEKVYIDNENPIIKNFKIKEITENSIQVETEATDELSGIKSYFYSKDGVNYEEGKINYTYRDLESNKEYTLYIKVVDHIGNTTILSVKEKTKTEKNTCDLNCDTNGDGKCDLNCDTDGDGKCDLNCDTDGDGKCDTNCTTNPTPEKPGKDPEEEKDLIVPEINLDKVPTVFAYGNKYDLPSYYKFGPSGGSVECTVEGNIYTDTSTLSVGAHTIECIAKGNNGINVRTSKRIEVKVVEGEDEIWDGWIRLNLYYPENSTNWEWRLGKEGEIRDGYENTGWEPYTGPILIRLEDIDDVYIRYTLNGEVITIPPKGKLLVDIVPEKYSLIKEEKTKVRVICDSVADVCEYRIGSGAWKTYEKEFEVEKNTLIEARVIKTDNIYDEEGKVLGNTKRQSTDSVWIGEILENGTGSGSGSGNTGEGGTGGPGIGSEPGTGGSIGGGSGTGGSETGSGSGSGSVPGGNGGTTNYTPETRPDGTVTTKPTEESKPSTYLEGPMITSSPASEIVEKVVVTVTPKEEAETVYISIGNERYVEYTDSIEVKQNTIVKAYYIRKSDGKISDTSYHYIQNIKEGRKPYVRIDATPSNYLSNLQKEVEVSISGSNYQTLEYSLDGMIYENYIDSFKMTESKTVYARGRNEYGETVEKLTITTKKTPSIINPLEVSIYAEPDTSEKLVNKTKVTIVYDSEATKKYYKLSGEKDYKEYTGPFELRENTTVYAYATGENKTGYASKGIDFLTTGIMAPIITTSPTTVSNMVTVTISFDKNATKQYYQINGGEKLYYTGPFEVYENSTIFAYNSNTLGYEADSSKEITNVVASPNYIILDQGTYYLIRLNYPMQSNPSGREYKWKKDGVWKQYDPHGILLIKPEYKDELLTADGVKIKDTDGKEIIITDHYYVIDVPMNQLMENLYMRWDTSKPKAPEIIISPNSEPSRLVNVGIHYPSNIVDKYYKVVSSDGRDSGWLKYEGTFKIEDNCIVYAKGMTVSEMESDVASRFITNIDKEAPVINVYGDFSTPKQQLTITVEATDNKMMSEVRWTEGEQKLEFFKENGTSVRNLGTFTVLENGKYTIYAVDQAGNESIKVIEVTNIDRTAPDIIIHVLSERLTTEIEVNIDYGDSVEKEYKIGETGNYQKYTENFKVNSYDVYNLANSDGSLTIYARGQDEAGNIQEVKEIIYILDLDIPKIPSIIPSDGYPTLTKDGMISETESYIIYDTTRDDLMNYYRVDEGEWIIYTGPIRLVSGKIEAKSVKEASGLTVTSEGKVAVPGDAVGKETYDNNMDTSQRIPANTTRKFSLASNVMGRKVRFYVNGTAAANATVRVLDKDGKELGFVSVVSPVTVLEIPEDGYRVAIFSGSSSLQVKEIDLRDESVIIDRSLSPIIRIDNPEWTYEKVVNIQYPEGNYRNEYSLDGGITWKIYESPFKVEENAVVIARVLKEEKVVSASSFTITKIDAEMPTIELNIPTGIQLGYDISLPTYYKIGASGGKAECKVGNTSVTNTNELKIGKHEIICTVKNNAGKSETVKKTIRIIDVSELKGDSILQLLASEDIVAGKYSLQVGDVFYPVHVYVYDGNQHFTENQVFGDASDVATANDYAQNMVVVKVNGDLTIDEGVTVRPYYDTTYGGPKGFTLYVTGKLTNNGTIDNSHGAKAEGQDVYLWKNADGTYEYIPAIGASSNNAGTGRQTGGGGNGTGTGGLGAAGTSYSGGSGGGGGASNSRGSDASPNGGVGGIGNSSAYYGTAAGGGAGNPGGSGRQSASTGYYYGSNGTGGLLILYADCYENNGTLTANGSSGGNKGNVGGGSGGGSINIFTKKSTKISQIFKNLNTGIDQIEIITNAKYEEMLGSRSYVGGGANGGSGTFNIGQIRNEQYYSLKEIIEQEKEEYKKSVTIEGDSILSILENNDLKSGYYYFLANGISYSVHLYTYDGDQHFTENQIFGDASDIATASFYAQNMVIVKVNGDLTIDNGVTVRPYYTEYGGPKGFTLYVTGKLTNNGTIDNSHGAKAEGEDVYLWKNTDGTYEYVPEIGGLSSTAGTGRQTGGGGKGSYNGANGAAGTSYSGGSGGVATCGYAGSPNGGAGGSGISCSFVTAGGAGNPGGSGSGFVGQNGTGGLLIIYADYYENNGSLRANGSNGAKYSWQIEGGGSGGGSINVFYNSLITTGEATVNGGSVSGGKGTITYSQIPLVSISSTYTYPTLSILGFSPEYHEVTIYKVSSIRKLLYSLDNGTTWKEYKETLKLKSGITVLAKGITTKGTETDAITYTTPIINDALPLEAYDNNMETIADIETNQDVNFIVVEDIIGKNLRVFLNSIPASDATIKIYDSSDSEILNTSLVENITVIRIPENSEKIVIHSGSTNLNIQEINIRIVNKEKVDNPVIEINNADWTFSKTIVITYPDLEYQKEYSLDLGETWQEYLSPITVDKETIVLARTVDNGNVISSSSFIINKIDSVEPTIELEIPDEIMVGDEYKLPTSYTVGKSGGEVICKYGDNIISNTLSLSAGNYTIECSLTNNAGVTVNKSKIINVKKDNSFAGIILEKNTVVADAPTLTTTSEQAGENGLYKSTVTNSEKPTYYFRGTVENNYVNFAGFTWRIVRINEDKTVRLILNSGVGNITFGPAGIVYYSDSYAKSTVESWYTENIEKNGYSKDVASGNYFCEQIRESGSKPSYKCDTDGNGRGLVNSNIGLITYDEVIFAGGYPGLVNTSNYLFYNTYNWTMSPNLDTTWGTKQTWMIWPSGVLTSAINTNYAGSIRPVINLNADVVVTGTGISSDPYVIE